MTFEDDFEPKALAHLENLKDLEKQEKEKNFDEFGDRKFHDWTDYSAEIFDAKCRMVEN